MLRSAGVTDMRFGNVLDGDWQARDRFERGADPRRPLPLPAGVDCYAIAGTTARAPAKLPNDGLALGVWRELRQRDDLPIRPPWSNELERALNQHPLPGNLRDLQRLAVLLMAWWSEADREESVRAALREWSGWAAAPAEDAALGQGSRVDRVRWFRARLAKWAKAHHGTWAAAAEALGCDEKALRNDAAPMATEP